MVATPSSMLALGTPAPDFALPDTEGKTVRRQDHAGKPLLVMFLCNHCPYVKHIADDLAQVTRRYIEKGVAVVGISSNDTEQYPEDSLHHMVREKRQRGYAFPYCFDETQNVARAYHAACTPDFFLFDKEHKLVYRGQFDDSRPSNGKPVTGADLTAAVDAVAAGKPPSTQQKPSMGCNIKWKAGTGHLPIAR
jgi:peroxiredoxin